MKNQRGVSYTEVMLAVIVALIVFSNGVHSILRGRIIKRIETLEALHENQKLIDE